MIVWLVLAAVSALLVRDYLRFTHHHLALRPMRDAPSHGELGDVVRLSGTVAEIEAPIVAPFSGTACAAFCVSARLVYSDRGESFNTTTLLLGNALLRQREPIEQQMTTFTLQTRQGRVLVRAGRVDLALPMRRRPWASSERKRAFAERWRRSESDVPRVQHPRERAVVVGDEISVLGLLTSVPGESARSPYRDAATELCLTEVPEVGLIIGPALHRG